MNEASTSQLQALLFDVDGTLAETEEAHRAAFNEAFRAFGLDWTWSQDDYRQLLKTTGGKERIRAHMDAIGFALDGAEDQGDFIARLHVYKTKLYTKIINDGAVPLRPGIEDLVWQCARQDMRMAIVTTTSYPNVVALINATLGKKGMALFEVVSSGDMVARKKPAPDLFLKALTELDLSAVNCLALEDSRNGLMSAMGADIATVITPSIYTDRDDFTGAALIAPTIADLAGQYDGDALAALISCHRTHLSS